MSHSATVSHSATQPGPALGARVVGHRLHLVSPEVSSTLRIKGFCDHPKAGKAAGGFGFKEAPYLTQGTCNKARSWVRSPKSPWNLLCQAWLLLPWQGSATEARARSQTQVSQLLLPCACFHQADSPQIKD